MVNRTIRTAGQLRTSLAKSRNCTTPTDQNANKHFLPKMKYSLLLFFCFFSIFQLSAQPENDDCSGLIDLGIAPVCNEGIFTNIDATASDIGMGNNPLCFNGGTTQNDVFFAFTTSDTILNYDITVQGNADGPNMQQLINPQVVLYRGSCVENGLAELFCGSAELDETVIRLENIGLTQRHLFSADQ